MPPLPDIPDLMSQLTSNFVILSEIIQSIAVIIGVVLTVGGIFQLKKHGEGRSMMSQQTSLAGPLMMIIAGAALLSLPSIIRMASLAFLGLNNPMALDPSSDYDIGPLLTFVRVIGVGSFVRGIVLLSRSGHQQGQQGTTGKAFIHIIAGVLAVHVVGTYDLLVNTFF